MSEESLIVKLKGDTADLDKKLDATHKSLDDVGSSVSGVDSELKTMSSTSRAAVSSISKLTETSKALNKTITNLNSKLIDSRAATKKASEEVDKLSKELTSAKESGSATVDEILSLEQALDKARSELVRNKQETNSLSGELKSAKSEYSSIQTEIKATTRDLGKLSDESKGSSSSINGMAGVAKAAGGKVVELSKAALAVGTALTTMITLSAKGERELQALSRQAKLATGDFEALAFATTQYGVNAEQIADISKDLSDRLGEFAATGKGTFQDFADVTGKTTEEAQRLAAEWQNLSSDQVIQEIANQLDAAGASANEATFVFESLGNDLSKLIPLFADNGKELQDLTQRYNEVNASLAITQEEAKSLQETATSFDLLTESLGNSTKVISAQLAPALNEFFNSIIEVVPTATNTIVDFINKFREAANIDSITSINRELEELTKTAADYEEQINAMQGGEYVTSDFTDDLEAQANGLSIVNQRIAELIEQRDKLTSQQDQVKTPDGGSLIPKVPQISGQEALDDLIERLKTEEQIRGEQYVKDLEIAGENANLRLEIERQYLEDVKALRDEAAAKDQERLDEQTKYFERILREQGKIDKENSKNIEKNKEAQADAEDAWADVAIKASNLIFEDNKAAAVTTAGINTAVAVTKALPNYPLAAAVAASGLIQVAAITSSSKGSSTTTTAPVSSVPESELPGNAPELSVGASDVSGSNTSVIKLEFNENTDLGAFLKKAIKTSEINGTA